MSPEKLVLSPLRKALGSLEAALRIPEVDDIVRDATIQRFEYTYELARKMLERHLVWLGEEGGLGKRTLYRRASELGIVGDAEAWIGYNYARNTTSHTYNESKAQEVYEAARAFAVDARRLLDTLAQIHD